MIMYSWIDAIKDIDNKVICKTLKNLKNICEYAPTPAKFRREALGIWAVDVAWYEAKKLKEKINSFEKSRFYESKKLLIDVQHEIQRTIIHNKEYKFLTPKLEEDILNIMRIEEKKLREIVNEEEKKYIKMKKQITDLLFSYPLPFRIAYEEITTDDWITDISAERKFKPAYIRICDKILKGEK